MHRDGIRGWAHPHRLFGREALPDGPPSCDNAAARCLELLPFAPNSTPRPQTQQHTHHPQRRQREAYRLWTGRRRRLCGTERACLYRGLCRPRAEDTGRYRRLPYRPLRFRRATPPDIFPPLPLYRPPLHLYLARWQIPFGRCRQTGIASERPEGLAWVDNCGFNYRHMYISCFPQETSSPHSSH